jgi:SNF2 family DNA or RNA helicase
MYTRVQLQKMTLQSIRTLPVSQTIRGRWKLKKAELIEKILEISKSPKSRSRSKSPKSRSRSKSPKSRSRSKSPKIMSSPKIRSRSKSPKISSPSLSLSDLEKMTVAELRNLREFGQIQNRWKLKKTDLIRELASFRIPISSITRVSKPKVKIVKSGRLRDPSLELLDHQRKVVDYITNPIHRSILVVHSTGAGKTITGLYSVFTLLKQKETNVIIIAPPSVLENWKKEIVIKGFADQIPDNFLFLSFDSFTTSQSQEFIDACEDAIVIIDEAHNLRTKIVGKTIKTGKSIEKVIKKGKKSFGNFNCVSKAWKVIIMTATPVVNSINDMKNLLAMLHNIGQGTIHIESMSALGNFMYKHNTPIAYFKAIQNVDTGYPDFNIHDKIIKLTPSERRRYNHIMSGLEKEWKLGRTLMTFYNGMRCAGDAGFEVYYSPKVKFIKEYLREHPMKTMVFSAFIGKGVHLVEESLDEIGAPIYKIIGATAKKDRQAIINEFNKTDDFKVMIISKAGKEGIDLKGVRTVFLLEPSWNEADSYQALSRAVRFQSHSHLPASKRKVDVYKLFLDNTVDTLLQKGYVVTKADTAREVERILMRQSI